MNELCKKKIPKKFQDIQKSPKNLQNIFKNVQNFFYLLMDLSQSLMSGERRGVGHQYQSK